MRHPPADDGGDPHDALGGVVELVDPGEQQPGEVAGVGPAALAGGGGELLGEEGVALGARGRPARRRRRDRPVPARRTMRRRSGSGSGPEVDAGERGQARPHAPAPRPAGGGGARRRCGRWRAGRRRRAAAGEQQGQQLAGRLVGPVHVLDDDEERPAAAEVGEGAVHGLDEVGAHGVAAGSRRPPGARGAPARGGRRRARRRGRARGRRGPANISTKGR